MVFLKLFRKDCEVGDAVRGDRNDGSGLTVEPSASEHRGVLHRRQIAVPSFARLCGQRERVRFGGTAGEDHVLGPRADQSRNLLAGCFDRRAGLSPLGMDRGWIADDRESCSHGIAHFRAKRRGGVVVEIGALVHALPKLAAKGRRLTLARAPVARAMKRGPKLAPPQVPSYPGAALFGTILILSCIGF